MAGAVFHLDFHADGLVSIENHLLDRNTLMNSRPLVAGVLDEHLVKNRAGHLPGNGALVVQGLEKIERARLLARRVRELDAVLADERAFLELFQESHALEGPVSIGHQRFTNVMTWELFFFKEHDAAAFAGEDAGYSAARRTAADYDNVITIFISFHSR